MIALENRAAGKKLDSGHFLRRKSELAQRAKDGPAALAFDRRIIAETIRVDHGRRATSPAGEFRRGPLRPMILDNAHGASLVFAPVSSPSTNTARVLWFRPHPPSHCTIFGNAWRYFVPGDSPPVAPAKDRVRELSQDGAAAVYR